MNPHDFWQELHAPGTFSAEKVHTGFFPAELGDGRQVRLPIRPLPDGEHALCSLIVNQASFAVVEALAEDLAGQLAQYRADVVVGLPTLGLTLASAVARHLGHTRYVPFGTSRKFWYDEQLSVPLSSITTPGQGKRLYVDPRMLPLLEGRRVALVDDVISSGTSIAAALELCALIGVVPVVIGAAMLQSDRWVAKLGDSATTIAGVFRTPLLRKAEGGWVPV